VTTTSGTSRFLYRLLSQLLNICVVNNLSQTLDLAMACRAAIARVYMLSPCLLGYGFGFLLRHVLKSTKTEELISGYLGSSIVSVLRISITCLLSLLLPLPIFPSIHDRVSSVASQRPTQALSQVICIRGLGASSPCLTHTSAENLILYEHHSFKPTTCTMLRDSEEAFTCVPPQKRSLQ